MPTPSTVDALDLARSLRAARRGDEAQALLDVALAQPGLQRPATVDVAGRVGWLRLERASLALERGDLAEADADVQVALQLFERAQERGGAATAALLAGDLARLAGAGAASSRWWQTALALADSAGNGALAARALTSLLLGGAAADAELDLDDLAAAAERRLQSTLGDALAPDDPRRADADAQQLAAELTLALCRVRTSVRRGDLAEARLALPTLLERAAELAEPGLVIEALRLDADLARRAGDAAAAVVGLQRAEALAERHDRVLALWAVRVERTLALIDDERWAEAFELAAAEPPAAIAALPALHAARLEAYAALSLRADQVAAARHALAQALALRTEAGDAEALARCRVLAAQAALAAGELDAALAEGDALAADVAAPLDARMSGALAADAALARSGEVARGASSRLARLDALTALVERAPLASAVAWHVARCEAALHAADVGTALNAARAAQTLAQRAPMLRLRARAAAAVVAALGAGDTPAMAVAEASPALRLAQESGDDRARAQVLLGLAHALSRQGRLDDAALAFSHAADAARGPALAALAADAQIGQAQLASRGGVAADAVRLWRRAAETALRATQPALAGHALRGLAQSLGLVGDVAGQRAALERAIAASPSSASLARVDLLRLRLQQHPLGPAAGDEAARAALRALAGDAAALAASVTSSEGAASAAASGAVAVRLEAGLVQAEALARAGDLAASWQVARQLEPSARAVGDRALGAWLLLAGQLEIAVGDGSLGGAWLAEALQVAGRVGGREVAAVRAVIERLRPPT